MCWGEALHGVQLFNTGRIKRTCKKKEDETFEQTNCGQGASRVNAEKTTSV